MELFSLLAKLTLDSSEFDKKIQSAEQSVKGIKVDEPVLTLDDSDFTEKIHNAQMESVDDMTGENAPELDLDKEDFDKGMDSAQDEKVDDMTGENAPDLGLDSTEFSEGIKDANEAGETFASGMTETFDSIRSALVATGIVAMITGLTNLITDAINKTTEMADTIDKQSNVLGISKTKYQEWDHALKQSGGSVSELSRGAIKFRTILDDVNKELEKGNSDFDFRTMTVEEQALKMKDLEIMTEEQSDAFKKLGISVLDANGNIKTSEQLMEDALVATSTLTGDEQLKVINDLFGRNVTGITNLVAGGKEQVKELLGEAQELGLVMSDEEIQQAVEYGDAVANLNAELDAIKSAFVEDIIPVLTDAVTWLTNFLEKLNPRLQTNSVYSVIDQINEKTLKANMNVDASTASAKKLIEDLQAMGDYWSLDEQGRMTWDALAAKALELFPQLSEYIDTDGKKIQGNTQDIENNIDAWARLEKQRLLSAAMAEKEEAVAKQLTAAYEKSAEAKEKEADAYGEFAKIVDQANKYIKENPNSPLVAGLQIKYGDDFKEISADSAEALEQLKMLGGVEGIDFGNYTKAKEKAETLREESNKMVQDAEKAQAGLEDQQKYLAEAMGLTDSDVLKVTESVKNLGAEINKLPRSVHIPFTIGGSTFQPKAIGDAYIPWDNYPALLHRGEKVVTATEARQNNSFDISGLEDRIEAAIRNGMDGVTVRSYLNGKEITDEVNRNTVNQVKARRFA